MIERVIGILRGKPGGPADAAFDRKQVAAGALLVESSRLDSSYDGVERRAIRRILAERFKLDDEMAGALLKAAEKSQSEVYSDFSFTEAVRESFSEGERAELVGMLWEIAYADGELHSFEEHMIRRVANEIGIAEARVETERKGALKRLGVPDRGA